MEQWKSVIGWEGIYDVSNEGRIRRIAPGKKTRPGRILKPHKRKNDGRLTVALSYHGKRFDGNLHSLVASTWIGPRPPGMEIDHIDGNPENNNIANLEYVTPQENMKRAYKLGLVKLKFGIEHYLAKLTIDQVRIIRSCTAPSTLLARVFSVTPITIRQVRRGLTWKHIKGD